MTRRVRTDNAVEKVLPFSHQTSLFRLLSIIIHVVCHNWTLTAELQITEGIKDNLKIIFLISGRKRIL